MLLLTSTSDKIQVVVSNSGANIDVHASWVDNASGTITPGRLNSVSLLAPATYDVVPAPGAGVQRNVKGLYITNTSSTVSSQVTVLHTDGSNVSDLMGVYLMPGENLVLDDTGQFRHHDANGGEYIGGPGIDYWSVFGVSGTIAESIPRILVPENALTPVASGTLFLQAIYLRAGTKINYITFSSGNTGASNLTNCIMGIYDMARNRLATTSNEAALGWNANNNKTQQLTSTFTVPYSGLFYVALLQTATTVASLKGLATKTSALLSGVPPILQGSSTTGLGSGALPASAAAITSGASTVWCAVS